MKKDGMEFATKALKADNQNKQNQRAMAMAYIANGLFEKPKLFFQPTKMKMIRFVNGWMDIFRLKRVERSRE
ncbi:MAG: hypothetical protein R2877_04545 [Bdellovibrionota bacterium]